MKDIKKTGFMLEAGDSGHSMFLEMIIGFLIMLLGSMIVSVIQVPFMALYLFTDKSYINMITSGSFNMDKILKIVSNLPEWMAVLTLFSEIALIGVTFLYCKFIEKRKLRTLGFVKKGLVTQYLKGAVLGLLFFGIAYVLCLITGAVRIDGAADNLSILYLIGYFGGYMVQGMAEEVLCRGYLMVSLSRRYHVSTSIIISAVFFALLHGFNPGISLLAYINLFLFGIFIALLFLKSENIWLVGAFHSVWNFVQGNLFGIRVSGTNLNTTILTSSVMEGREAINGGAFGMEGGIAVTVVLVVGCFILIKLLEKDGKVIDASEQPSRIEIEFRNISSEMGINPDMPFGAESSDNREKQKESQPMENMPAKEPVAYEDIKKPEEVTQEVINTPFDENYFKE